MKRRTFLGVAGSALTGTAVGLLPVNTKGRTRPGNPTEATVLELQRKWMTAMVDRDEATLQVLMADDFKRIEKPSPNLPMFKPQWVGNAIKWNRIEGFRFLSLSAQVSGKTAVVSSRYRWRGALGEVPISEIVTAEDTWELRNGQWQVVSQFISHTEKLKSGDKPLARRKTIMVDPAIYAAYVGSYKFGHSRVLSITCEDGRLIHQGSGGQRAELFPETATRYFRKDAPVLTTFVKDKHGQVTHVVHQHTSGRQSIGTRMA